MDWFDDFGFWWIKKTKWIDLMKMDFNGFGFKKSQKWF